MHGLRLALVCTLLLLLMRLCCLAAWRARTQLMAVTGRGRMGRCFYAWLALCEERWWKNQLAARDERVGLPAGQRERERGLGPAAVGTGRQAELQEGCGWFPMSLSLDE